MSRWIALHQIAADGDDKLCISNFCYIMLISGCVIIVASVVDIIEEQFQDCACFPACTHPYMLNYVALCEGVCVNIQFMWIMSTNLNHA